MREQVIDHLLYTYQKASDEDLQAYVKLHEQPGAHTVLRLITQAIGAALIDMQRDAFELTARERRGGERF